VNKEDLTNEIISEILKKKDKYAKKKITKEKILTEYCHANTHKAFHIGHTRNICMGESISRIIENQGIKVIRTNYQGDIGMHVAKTLWGMLNLKKIGLKEPNNLKEKGKWLGLVYAKASGASEDEKIKQEINEINQKLYSGDKKLLDLWKKTRKWSIDYFEHTIYPDFETKFKEAVQSNSELNKTYGNIWDKIAKNRAEASTYAKEIFALTISASYSPKYLFIAKDLVKLAEQLKLPEIERSESYKGAELDSTIDKILFR
jgi:arginyl-tRNA synthetase